MILRLHTSPYNAQNIMERPPAASSHSNHRAPAILASGMAYYGASWIDAAIFGFPLQLDLRFLARSPLPITSYHPLARYYVSVELPSLRRRYYRYGRSSNCAINRSHFRRPSRSARGPDQPPHGSLEDSVCSRRSLLSYSQLTL